MCATSNNTSSSKSNHCSNAYKYLGHYYHITIMLIIIVIINET